MLDAIDILPWMEVSDDGERWGIAISLPPAHGLD